MSAQFLAEMGWKSALISAAALLLLVVLRSRSAADRAAVVRLAVGLLLATPLISYGLPALQVETPAAVAPHAIVAAPEPLATEQWAQAAAPIAQPPMLLDAELLIALTYLAGLLLVALRLGMGLATLNRWTASAREISAPAWTEALRRSRAAGAPDARLLVSEHVPSPMSWGWRNPVILLDPATLARAEDADAVVAHEMAHVARRDWAALMLSRAAVALFWFNPLVWLLDRQAVQHAEEAADVDALGRVEPAAYAQTLVTCARHGCGNAVPANSIAPSHGSLSRRVKAILDGGWRERRSGSRWTLAAMAGCVAFAAPVAALKLVSAPVEVDEPAPVTAEAIGARIADVAAPVMAAAAAEAAEAAVEASAEAAAVAGEAAAEAVLEQREARIEAQAEQAAQREEMERRDADEGGHANVLPHQPVPPAPPAPPVPPVPGASATPPAPPAPPALIDIDTLVSMKIHGVTGQLLGELAAIDPRYRRLPLDTVVGMRIHGVSASYIRGMAAEGYRGLSPDQLIKMRIHGVGAADARRAAALLGRRPSAEELVKLSIAGVI